MDQLELLKKNWKKLDHTLPKLSREEISKLIHKKSSSIVKWIFIISLLEFIIPNILLLFADFDKYTTETRALGLLNFSIIFNTITYIVIIYFIYRFYKNYKSISADSNPKVLMQNIIKTRRSVKHYIWFNLAMIPIISLVTLYKKFSTPDFLEKLPEGTSMLLVWFLTFVLVAVIVTLTWLFYRLLYGILLQKLKKNYNELVYSNGDDCG
jgi:membrane protein implicated in regulation of membrane protease activity